MSLLHISYSEKISKYLCNIEIYRTKIKVVTKISDSISVIYNTTWIDAFTQNDGHFPDSLHID